MKFFKDFYVPLHSLMLSMEGAAWWCFLLRDAKSSHLLSRQVSSILPSFAQEKREKPIGLSWARTQPTCFESELFIPYAVASLAKKYFLIFRAANIFQNVCFRFKIILSWTRILLLSHEHEREI